MSVNYSRADLVKQDQAWNKRKAAILDYVGTVYGEKGKVKFDNQLTDKEKAYVEKTFGRLSSSKDIENYLYNAKLAFFKRLKISTPAYCRNIKAINPPSSCITSAQLSL